MSEWLDLMLDEVARKRRERKEAMAELERRKTNAESPPADEAADKTSDNTTQPGEPSPDGK